MWLQFARAPLPDAPSWSGRRLLAAVDAAVWPLGWVIVVSRAPGALGIVLPVVAALALLCALGRLRRALWVNHRYHFTTWRWGRIAAALLLIGAVLRVMLPASMRRPAPQCRLGLTRASRRMWYASPCTVSPAAPTRYARRAKSMPTLPLPMTQVTMSASLASASWITSSPMRQGARLGEWMVAVSTWERGARVNG